MDISVIIPTRNRPAYLLELLNSLKSQTLDPSRFEVIVVDNGSDDETRRAVAALEAETPFRLRYLREPAPGLHNARHAGMMAAQSDILVFADDDILPFDTWLAAVSDAFSRQDVWLVGGRNLPLWETPPPNWLQKMWNRQKGDRIIGYLSILDLGDRQREVAASLVWGCNFSVRKSLLQETEGFHPDAMPEELIHLRGDGETYISSYLTDQGYQAYYHPDASVHHRVPPERMTFAYFRKRAYSQGISDSYTDLRKSGGTLAVKAACPAPSPLAVFRCRVKKCLDVGIFWSDSVRLGKETAAGYREGYHYHQSLFAEDQKIRDWVLQNNYL